MTDLAPLLTALLVVANALVFAAVVTQDEDNWCG